MEERLKQLLATMLGVDAEKIDDKASSETIEGWDSLKQMNIVVAVEEEFGLQFDEEESILSNSYASLIQLIRQKTSK
jgi:acyl carrier protein